MPDYNTIDLVLLALLAIGAVRGGLRGLSGELAGLLSLALAAVAGWHYYRPLGEYLAKSTRMTDLQADTVAFVVVIICALILIWALSTVLRKVMEFTFKGLLERVGGVMVGFLRYAVILAGLLLVVSQWTQGRASHLITEESFLGRHAVERLVPMYRDLVERYPGLPALPVDEPPVEREEKTEKEVDEGPETDVAFPEE